MILYLDSSALVKRYIDEAGSDQVAAMFQEYRVIGTATITRAEISAAFKKAARIGLVGEEKAKESLLAFRAEWESYHRLPLSAIVISRADALAWDYDLRGYDAVHLAAALLWGEGLNETVAMATFDRQLWQAAQKAGLGTIPEELV